MSFFSFFKKKKKNTIPDVSDYSLAEDALKTSLVKPNIEPIKCVALDPSSVDSRPWCVISPPCSRPRLTNMTLVKGSSDSKPASESGSTNRQHRQTSSVRRDSRTNSTKEPEITSVQYVHKAAPHTRKPSEGTTSKLYPDLDGITVPRHTPSVRTKPTEVKEVKSIHDMLIETSKMGLTIHARIAHVNMIERKFNLVKNDTHKKIQAIKNIIKYNKIKNLSKFEYTFDKELEVKRTCSQVKVYKKLHTFNDVKNCHQKVNEPIKDRLSNDTNAVPIFKSYREKFRCYKGQKRDIIDCD